MPTTRVKICGLTRLPDAELAVELGAWAIGMVFYERSPRRCSLEQAEAISTTLRRRAELCGVFVNATIDEVARVSDLLGLTMLQLHGDEGPSFCAEAARRTGAKVVKALQVADAGDVREAERYHTDYHLLDARSAMPGRESLRGGTGEMFDWELLAGRRSKVPLILSGGIGPDNVAAAIESVAPFAVDTASAIESAPGLKDPSRLRDFFAAVALGSAPHLGHGGPAAAGSSDGQLAPSSDGQLAPSSDGQLAPSSDRQLAATPVVSPPP